jgi:hypothetical protein
MKRGLLSSALAIPVLAIPVLAIPVLATCVAGSASAASASITASASPTPSTAKPSRFVVIDCASKPRTRPVSFVIACADGNNYLTRLTWTKWTQGLASGEGRETANDCQPSCAQGKLHIFHVQVILRGSAVVKRHGRERRYTTLTLHYPGLRPRYQDGRKWISGPETVTYQLWS